MELDEDRIKQGMRNKSLGFVFNIHTVLFSNRRNLERLDENIGEIAPFQSLDKDAMLTNQVVAMPKVEIKVMSGGDNLGTHFGFCCTKGTFASAEMACLSDNLSGSLGNSCGVRVVNSNIGR